MRSFSQPIGSTGSLGIALALTLLVNQATASELVYRPVNPNFGGRPLNGNFLLGNAQSQNDFDDPDQGDATSSERFIRTLESRLLSGLASQVADAIFGDNAQDSGTVVFDNQTINFTRGLETIAVQIVDTDTGAITVIEVPTLRLD